MPLSISDAIAYRRGGSILSVYNPSVADVLPFGSMGYDQSSGKMAFGNGINQWAQLPDVAHPLSTTLAGNLPHSSSSWTLGGGTGANTATYCDSTTTNYLPGIVSTGRQAFPRNITKSGLTPASDNCFFYNRMSATGSSSADTEYFGTHYVNDLVSYSGVNRIEGFSFGLNIKNGATGSRTALAGNIIVENAVSGMTSASDLVAVGGRAQASVSLGGVDYSIAPTSFIGSLWGLWGQARLKSTASGYQALIGLEIDVSMASTTSAALRQGIAVNLESIDAKRGSYSDVGLIFNSSGSVGWGTVIGFGGVTSSAPFTATTTLIKTPLRRYGIPSNPPSPGTALHGIDFREVLFSSGSFSSHGFDVDGSGETSTLGLVTHGSISAKTASVASIAVDDGGVYPTITAITIQPPASGGTQAEASVSAVGAAVVHQVVSGGAGYTTSDVLTVSGGAYSTQSTVIVDTVDGSGAITSAHIGTAGSYSAIPGAPSSTSGGSGSGAQFTLLWKILSVSVDVAGDGYQQAPLPYIVTNSTSYRMATLTPTMDVEDTRMTVYADLLSLDISSIKVAANDTAAATSGVAINEVYRNGSTLMIRIS